MNEGLHLSTEALSAYLDRESAESERVSIAAHLESCARCRGRLEELQRLASALQRLPIPPVSSHLRTQISRATAPRREGLRWVYAAAAVVAGVAVMLILFERRPELAPAEPQERVAQPSDQPEATAPMATPLPSLEPPPAPAPAPAPAPETRVVDQPEAKRRRQENAIDVIEQTAPKDFREEADEQAESSAASAPLTARGKSEAQIEKREAGSCVTLPTTFLVRTSAGATGFSRWFENRTGYAPQVETFSPADGYTFQVPRAVWERYKGEPLVGLDPEVACVRFRVQLTE